MNSSRRTLLAALLLVPALACGGAQTHDAAGGDIEPLASTMCSLGLLPGQLIDGEEPAEGIVVDEPEIAVEGLVDVDSLMTVAVTADLEMLVESEGERVPLRLSLISYQGGLHVYGVETMTGFDGIGSHAVIADEAAEYMVEEARAGRWATQIASVSDMETALPSTVRMVLMNHGDMMADLIAVEPVLASGRVIEARLGSEVVVYGRREAELDLFQAVLELDMHDPDQLRVAGPPHVVLSPLSPAVLHDAEVPAK